MTPNKRCAHYSELVPGESVLMPDEDSGGAFAVCIICKARFVPADVLEEARKHVENAYLDDKAMGYTGQPIRDLLARIDAVLGKSDKAKT